MDPTTKYFLLGAIGACAPEIIRLYSIATGGQAFTWSWFYVIVSILFAGLGGLVAVLLPTENGKAAFYAGLTTPILINTAVKKGRSGGRSGGGATGGTPKPSTDKSAADSGVGKEQATGPRQMSRFDSFIEGL